MRRKTLHFIHLANPSLSACCSLELALQPAHGQGTQIQVGMSCIRYDDSTRIMTVDLGYRGHNSRPLHDSGGLVQNASSQLKFGIMPTSASTNPQQLQCGWQLVTCAQDGHLDVAGLQSYGEGSNEDVHALLLLEPANVAKQRHGRIYLWST